MNRRTLALRSLLSCLVLVAPSTAAATGGDTWPTLAHDFMRTSRSPGQGEMTTPELEWQRTMGGALSQNQIDTADVNSDGTTEIVMASSGKVVARRADGTLVWASASIGATRVVGVFELDGQGQPEVVAIGSSPPGVYVLSAFSGAQRWYSPTVNTAVDVLVAPAAVGSMMFLAEQRGPLTAWQFGAGLLDPASNLAWQAPGSEWSVDMVLGDVDGDGASEIVRGRDRGFTAYDVASGAIDCDASGLIGGVNAPAYFPSLETQDVNGDGRDEVVVYDYSYFYSEDAGVFVVSCPGDTPPLSGQALWQEQWVTDADGIPGTNVNAKQLRTLADAVADYDGKPGLEIVYSLWDAAASSWTTVYRHATTGAVIATKAGWVLDAAGDLDDDGRAEVLLRQASGIGSLPKPYFSEARLFDLHIGVFHDFGWSIPKARAATVSPRRTRVTTDGAGVVAARQNMNGALDPAIEVYLFSDVPGQGADDPRPGRLLAVHGPDGVQLAEYDFPQDVSGEMMMLASGLAQPGAEAESLVMLNDGGLRVLDSSLAEQGKLKPGNFALMPAVVSLDGVANTIVTTDSTDTLVALDGTKLSGGSAALQWRIRDTMQTETRGYVNAPGVLVPGASPAGAVLVVRGHKIGLYEEQSLFAIDASGSPAWSTDLGTGRAVAGFESFELLDDLDQGGVGEIFLTEIDPAGTQELVIRRGEDGATLAAVPTNVLFPGADYLQGHAAADINGDGVRDVISALHGNWFVGIDVSQAGTGDPSLAFVPLFRADASPNGQAMIGELDGEPDVDLLRGNSQNAFGPYERRDTAGNVEASFTGPHPGTPSTDTNLVALVAHPGVAGQFDFAWAGMAGAAIGRVSLVDGAAFSPVWTVVLSKGAAYPSNLPPAEAAALYDPIAVDIDGDGADEIVVGSDDGWLYALRAADGSRLFSKGLGAPVVHVIAADVDKDPQVELVVSLSDGRLAVIDEKGKYTADDVTPAGDAGVDGEAEAGGDSGVDGAAGTGGAGGSAGSGGSGGGGPASDAGDDAGGGAPGGDQGGSADGGGCGCSTVPADSSAAGWLVALLGIGIGARLRRRGSSFFSP